MDQCVEELRVKTAAHDAGWGLGSADWAADLKQGLLTFTSRTTVATAPVQVIGTYNTQDETWLWGWDHPSVGPAVAGHARRVLQYGIQNEIAELTTRMLPCSQDRAWEFTALACHLSGAQGAYRGPAGKTLVFMTFGKVTLSKRKG
jgi:hypothetical protein